jgi:tetratricopeptide (TPR) repeat protein
MTSNWNPSLLAGFLVLVAATGSAAEPQGTAPVPSAPVIGDSSAETQAHADSYYNLMMGHFSEQMYESTSRNEYASQAIEFYKKAYALDPHSNVIGERLAEMYWEAQRIPEAEADAQAILKRDPNDLPTRRLLGRIYLHNLGDLGPGSAQSESAARAIEQFREILRLDPSDAESALWLARLYRMQNEHEKAGQVLRGFLKQDPDNEQALEQLSQLLLDEGKPQEAVKVLEDATKDSFSPTLLDLLGDAYLQTKNYDRAAGAYRRAIDLNPGDASHHRGLAQALMSQENYGDALAEYQKLAELDPDDPDVYLRLAQVYRELHQLDRAEENLAKARQRAPGNIEIIYNEAVLYEAQGRFEDAIRVLSDAVTGLKAKTNVPGASRRPLAILYQQLGHLYREVQNFKAAVNTFEEMTQLGDEEDARARLLIMDTYREAKDLPRALEEADKALGKYPKDQKLLESKALLLGEKGDTDGAAGILRGLLTGSAADRDMYLNIAQVYERGHRYAEAEAAARTAEKLSGQPRENGMIWFLLGAIYEREKQYDRAEEEFKRVLALDPHNAPALNYYGYMLGDRGIRLDEAHALVERALAEEPYNGAYLDSLGWVDYKQGRLSEAESLLRKAVERESHDPTIHGHLGDVYFKAGRTALAAQEWEKSLAEWRRALPTELESDKVAEIESKLTGLKRHLAQEKPGAAEAKPQ